MGNDDNFAGSKREKTWKERQAKYDKKQAEKAWDGIKKFNSEQGKRLPKEVVDNLFKTSHKRIN